LRQCAVWPVTERLGFGAGHNVPGCGRSVPGFTLGLAVSASGSGSSARSLLVVPRLEDLLETLPGAQGLGGDLDGLEDLGVAGAATQVSGQRGGYLLARGRRGSKASWSG
jgi:hypothetical protein